MKILYLEDNRFDAELTLRALAESSAETEMEVVQLMHEALARVAHPPEPDYDLILTDLGVPDGDGLEFLAHLRSNNLAYAIVVVTARSDEATVISALKAGADDYLIKRGDYLARLPATLELALKRHRAELALHARPLRVLYAESSPADIAMTMVHMQAHAGHIQIDAVPTAEDLLRRLAGDRHAAYDVILLDYSIPDLHAFEILKEIGEVRRLEIPVVVVTSHGSEEIVLQATRLGASDYLVKNPGYLFHLPAVIENSYHRHRLAEEQAALRAAEHKYRTLVEQVPGAIYMCKVDALCSTIFMSPQIETITGYSAETWVDTPELWQTLIHADDRLRVMEENERTNLDGQPFRVEYRIIARDGRPVWIRDEALLIRDRAGRPHFWQGVMIDVSERMQTEEALRRRDAIMEAVSFAAEMFLSAHWENSIQVVLERLGHAADVSRVYIYRNHTAGDGSLYTDQFYEWSAPGIAPQIGNEILQNLDLDVPGLNRLVQSMSAGRPVQARLRDVPDEYRSLLMMQDVQAVVCVPIFDGDEWWGFIGFHDCSREREWSTTESEPLRAAANILGAAIHRARTEQALQRQFEELTVLHAVAIDGTQSTSTDDLLARVTATLGDKLYPDNFGILLADETGRFLRPHRSYAGISEGEKQHVIPSDEGIAGRVFRSGTPSRVADVRLDPDFVAFAPDILSEVCVPIRSGERNIGVINVESARLDFFSDGDERLLVTIAGQLATAIEKIRLLEVEHQRFEESETLRQAAALISTSLELKSVLKMIQISLNRVLPYDGSTVFLIEGEELRVVAMEGYSRHPQYEEKPLKHWGALFDEIHGTRQVIIIPDVTDDPRFERWSAEPIRGWMGIPLIVRDQVIGFLTIDSFAPGAYRPAQSVLAETYAYQAAAAINNARLFEETTRRLKELEVVNRISTSLRVANTPAEMLPLLLDEALSVLDMQAGAIWLYEADPERLSQVVARGWFSQFNGEQSDRDGGLPGYIYSLGKPYIVDDLSQDEHLDPANRKIVPPGWSCAGIPIHTASEVIGVLCVSGASPSRLRDDEIGLLNTLAEIAGTAIHRVLLYDKTQQQVQHLVALRDIDIAISSSFDLRVTLEILLDHALAQLHIDAADILLLNPHTQMLELEAVHGFRVSAPARAGFRLGEGFAGRVALEHRMQIVPDLRTETGRMRPDVLSEGFVSYVGIPLVAKGQTKGVLELFNRSAIATQGDWLEFLQAIGSQAAIAVDNAQLFNNLQRSNLELALAYDTTLEGWGKALELRDPETEGHTLRVAQLALKLATALGVTGDDLVQIRRGALLHDIGKMGVPDPILRKTGSLNADEWEIMRKHVTYAFDLLSPIDYMQKALDIPYCHHERWNGKGYPRGLKREEIPRAARIFTVVDVWDALRSDRPYRKAWPRAEVIAYLKQESGQIFDPEIAKAFLDLVDRAEIN